MIAFTRPHRSNHGCGCYQSRDTGQETEGHTQSAHVRLRVDAWLIDRALHACTDVACMQVHWHTQNYSPQPWQCSRPAMRGHSNYMRMDTP
jgi:hypothetical protein